MSKEKCPFRLEVSIKENNWVGLSKKIDLEVDWDKSKGKIEKQVVEIEKDKKTYKFILEAEIKKGWFRDEVSSFELIAAPEEKFTILGYETGKQRRGMGSGLIKKKEEKGVIPLQSRTTGFYLISAILLLIGSIVVFILWKRKKKSYLKP